MKILKSLNLDKQLLMLYAIGVIYSLIRICGGYGIYYDTWTYITAFDVFLSGNLDLWRTPVYPLVLGFSKAIGGENHMCLIAIIIQYIYYFVGFFYYYRLAKAFINNNIIVFILSCMYLCSPSTIGTCSVILTESLSITTLVLFVYNLFKVWQPGTKIANFFAVVLLGVVLIMLRPALIYILVAMGLCAAFLLIKNWRKGLLLLLSTSIVIGVEFAYCDAFKKQFGVSAPGCVGIFNNYYIARQDAVFDFSVIDDDLMRADFENNFSKSPDPSVSDFWGEIDELFDKYGIQKVNDVLYENIIHNPAEALHSLISRCTEESAASFSVFSLSGDYGRLNNVKNIFEVKVPISYTYWIIIFYSCLLCVQIWRRHSVPFSFILLLLVLGHYAVTILGAPYDFIRLNLPVFPLVLLFSAQLLDMLKYERNKKFIFR